MSGLHGQPRTAYRYANIPQPLLSKGEGEQEFKVPLSEEEGFRVRANKGDMFPLKPTQILERLLLLPQGQLP
jgi:hypothetical protein